MWVTVCGNDDDREVWLHTDELHISSRLRQILTHDRPELPLRLSCSRDTLRSLIATQRSNRLLIQGSATFDDLTAELERDCVDIAPLLPTELQNVYDIIECLANAIQHWPMMRLSMQASLYHADRCDWDVSPTHCNIRFGYKPKLSSVTDYQTRPLFAFMMLAALVVDERASAASAQASLDEMASRNPSYGPFWWLTYDGSFKPSKKASLEDIARRIASAQTPTAEVCRRWASKQHNLVPNIGKLARSNVFYMALNMRLARCGLVVEDAAGGHRDSGAFRALHLPTMWVFKTVCLPGENAVVRFKDMRSNQQRYL